MQSRTAPRRRGRAVLLTDSPFMDFDAFYRSEFASMVALARGICGDATFAEDMAQEALSKAHQNWEKVSSYERPGAWLRRVTINLAISRRRRMANELKTLRRKALERRPEEVIDPGRDHDLWDAVQELPPRQRAVIALFYQEDRSTRDIAEILECTVSTATSHLNQARSKLAKVLGEAIENSSEPSAPAAGDVRRAERKI